MEGKPEKKKKTTVVVFFASNRKKKRKTMFGHSRPLSIGHVLF